MPLSYRPIPRIAPGLDHPVARFLVSRSPRNNAMLFPPPSRHYRPTLKYGATIVSLSLSRRWCNLVFELAIFLRMWEGEEHLGAASRHARLVVLFPNGALPRASKRCSTAGCVEGNKKKRRRKEAVEWFEGEERDRDWTTGFAQPAASSFLDIWTRQPLRSAL